MMHAASYTFLSKIIIFSTLRPGCFLGLCEPPRTQGLRESDATTSARIILRFAILSLDESLILDLFIARL